MKLENNDTFAITWNAEKHKTRKFRKTSTKIKITNRKIK